MKRRSFAVIGLGRFGSAMATTLNELGHDVLGIDSDPENVRRLGDLIPHVVELDATDERALRAAGVADVDVAVVSIGADVQANLLAVMLVKDLGVKTVVAKAATGLHGRILEKIGVSRVVFAERDMAIRVAHSLVAPNVIDYFELSRDFSIVELPAPPSFIGKTMRQLELRARHGLTVIALMRRGQKTGRETTPIVPGPDDSIAAGDLLVLVGGHDAIARIDDLQ
jgi:trk system potassium uptake protein TrkA